MPCLFSGALMEGQGGTTLQRRSGWGPSWILAEMLGETSETGVPRVQEGSLNVKPVPRKGPEQLMDTACPAKSLKASPPLTIWLAP